MNTALLRQSRSCATTKFGSGYEATATNFKEWWALYYNGPNGLTDSGYEGSTTLAFEDADIGKPRITGYAPGWFNEAYGVPV